MPLRPGPGGTGDGQGGQAQCLVSRNDTSAWILRVDSRRQCTNGDTKCRITE